MSDGKDELISFQQGLQGYNDGSLHGWMGSVQRDMFKSNNTSSSGTVICTELRRQRLITDRDYLLISRDSRDRLTETQRRGYLAWAMPVVQKMRGSRRWTAVAHYFMQARIDEVAARNGEKQRGNLIGKLTIWIGEPMCSLLGRSRWASRATSNDGTNNAQAA